MNFHTDKIECVLILFHILIVHIISASPYKLKNIILAPYIGKPQEGVDNKLIALKKQILLIRSRNKQSKDQRDENLQLVAKKTRGSRLDYRPYVHVLIDGRTDVSDGPLFRTDVALSPDMTLYDAVAGASVRFGVDHPCIENPYRLEVASAGGNCYNVINVPGVVSNDNSRWIIQIVRRRGRVVYDGECLPSGRLTMRGGTTVTFKKVS
ncbi:uncharacterized protein LOC111136188 isoform X1 [Crassostrea virginica]|uniref:Uncharacterized protein LOC111136188 isoform X1 n=1 Tax=Crassostrea virginica TaxID=6565 RepID=A0A8B8ERL8_CRAVI|nr:uncharacterized protein LOC111136188 isoform X1 [Crassostrea virginica]